MILKLGWRNIWRNRRRTLISMSAVGVGLALVIVYAGLMAALLGEATSQLDTTGMGHVEMYASGFRPKRSAGQVLSHPEAVIAKLTLPAGAEVGRRLVSRALASSARASEGVELLGVDWADEQKLSRHLNDVRRGGLPAPDDTRGIVVGDGLAERLKVGVGSKVRLTVQRADGEMAADLFRVRGVFHSIAASVSRRNVYLGVASAECLLGLSDAAHQIVVQLPAAGDAPAVAAQVRATLGEAVDVTTWGELLPMLKTMENMMDAVVTGAGLFVYLLVGLGILNTMLMSVLERTREFGILLAVGTRPRRVVATVLAESFWIATLSASLGLAVGLALTWWGSSHPLMVLEGAGEAMEFGGATLRTAFHTQLDIPAALRAAAWVYLMALVVGLYPAWRVSRMRPAEALRRS